MDVHEVKNVGKNAEWLKISFKTSDEVRIQGWVYAGRTGNWVNVRRMDNSHSFHMPNQSNVYKSASVLDLIIANAYAEDKKINKSTEDEGRKAPPLYVLFVIIFNVVVLLAAMIAAKKFISPDIKIIIFTGVSTLLIEGVVTEAGFWGWMENFF
jgi:hypothetical protein